ncbi:MAG: COR domain-containing protein [Anaerolineales bacterium]
MAFLKNLLPKDKAYRAEQKIADALRSGATELDLSGSKDSKLTEIPDSLWKLTQLTSLDLSNNQLTALPDSLGQLTQLTKLDLSNNQLTALPDSLGQLTQLTELNLAYNRLTALPDSLGQLTQLTELDLSRNQLTTLPESLKQLTQLRELDLQYNKLSTISNWLGRLLELKELGLEGNQLTNLPLSLANLTNLTILWLGDADVGGNPLIQFPECIRQMTQLSKLGICSCQLTSVPDWVAKLTKLETLYLSYNNLSNLPPSLAQLEHLDNLLLDNNPLNPALQSAYDQGLPALKAYLRSLEQNAEPLYEAKLVLVGEGNVGKTTLLKALKGKEGDEAPRKDESKTHGVAIDIHGLKLPHPEKNEVEIQLNAWDFGGQEIYRVTHQFFFSRRSLYVLVWEPRRNVQQAQIEDWLNMIRLRVGVEARVLIVSTHCKSGETLARIDKPVLQQQYGDMIVGFYEVDSLVPDPATGEMTGIVELKKIIAEESAKLQHMGTPFNLDWKAARDELIARPEAHINYRTFTEVCSRHKLSEIDTTTLAAIMNDLGYIVHYSDDEKLRDDVVLKPEWLTKAIGFVLENRATAEREGILPDSDLHTVWHDHAFPNEPRYDSTLYPFFLRLMEKYDVCYRLTDGKASLVAQHVPQVRPELPWLPEQEPPKDQRRIAMVCALEEDPPGLVPWMIVRTHDYAYPVNAHSLHWQKGMFLSHGTHGEAILELRGREFHVHTQATYPEYFMNILQETLQKLIRDNWPGLEGRYRLSVPCPTPNCKGRFNIQALRQFMSKGVREYSCQECINSYPITKLLLGFEERPIETQLREINERLAGMDSRIAHYFMATMNAIADEAKSGPRLFTFRSRDAGLSPKQIFTRPISLQLWCEAEGCQHPIIDDGKGLYSIDQPHDWVMKIAPYANFALDILKTVAPIAGPAINTFFGAKTTELWGIADHLSLAGAILSKVPDEIKTPDKPMLQRGMVSEPERSGILALHRLLNELDPNQENLGLHRVATYTGDFRWLCKRHYDAYQPNIPDVIK